MGTTLLFSGIFLFAFALGYSSAALFSRRNPRPGVAGRIIGRRSATIVDPNDVLDIIDI